MPDTAEARGSQTVLLSVLKWLFLILTIVFLFVISSAGRVSTADFADVSAAVTEAADLSPMLHGDNQMIRRLYGLDPADYDGMLLYYPAENMGAEELLLVKLSDMDQQETVKEAMETRRQGQMDVFESYAPEQYSMLKDGIIEVEGNYLLLVVGDDAETAAEAFRKAL